MSQANQSFAMTMLMQLGYTKAQASGIVGNLVQESGGLADDVVSGKRRGDDGTAGYVAQWRGPRLAAYKKFAMASGQSPGDLGTQIKFLHHELQNDPSQRWARNRLALAQTPEQATEAMIGYERPRGFSTKSPRSGHGWENRLKAAYQVAGMAPVQGQAGAATMAGGAGSDLFTGSLGQASIVQVPASKAIGGEGIQGGAIGAATINQPEATPATANKFEGIYPSMMTGNADMTKGAVYGALLGDKLGTSQIGRNAVSGLMDLIPNWKSGWGNVSKRNAPEQATVQPASAPPITLGAGGIGGVAPGGTATASATPTPSTQNLTETGHTPGAGLGAPAYTQPNMAGPVQANANTPGAGLGAPAYVPPTAQQFLLTHLTPGHSREHITNMKAPLANGLTQLLQSAPPEIAKGLNIFSGTRTEERQRELWNAELKKQKGNVAAARKNVAPPGHSQHEHGNAADLEWNGQRLDKAPKAVRDWVHANAPKFGLGFRMAHEPWHIEATGKAPVVAEPQYSWGGPGSIEDPSKGVLRTVGATLGTPTPVPLTGGASSAALVGDDMDDLFEQRVAPQVAAPETATTPIPVDEMDDLFEKRVSPVTPQVAVEPTTPEAPDTRQVDPFNRPGWGPLSGGGNLMNAAGLGLTPYTRGAGRMLDQWMAGEPIKPYWENVADVKGGLERFKDENPVGGIAADVVGSMPSTMMGLGLAGQGIRAVGQGIGRAIPAAESSLNAAGRFLSGQSGRIGGGTMQTAKRLLSGGAAGTLEGGGAAVLNSNLSDRPLGEQVATGAILGGALGPAVSGVSGAITDRAMNATISQGNKDLMRVARGRLPEGALPRGGQMAEQDAVRKLDERLFAGQANTDQIKAATKKAMETTGSRLADATPENIALRKAQVGNTLENVVDSVQWRADPQTLQEGMHLRRDMLRNLAPGSNAQRQLDGELERILIVAGAGRPISGQLYQNMTSSKSTIGKWIASKDPILSRYASHMRDLLDNSIARHVARQPAQMTVLVDGVYQPIDTAYNTARQQWRNLSIIEDATRSNSSGVIDPQALYAAARKRGPLGVQAIGTPENDMTTLARAGENLPRTTRQGAATEPYSQPLRVISSVLSNAAPMGVSAGAMGAAHLLGAPVAGTLAVGAGTFALNKGRDAILRRLMRGDDYRGHLAGDRYSTGQIAKTGTYVRQAIETLNNNIRNRDRK